MIPTMTASFVVAVRVFGLIHRLFYVLTTGSELDSVTVAVFATDSSVDHLVLHLGTPCQRGVAMTQSQSVVITSG